MIYLDFSKAFDKDPYGMLIQKIRCNMSYPTRPGQVVLRNFNLTLPASKMVAIVGQSGAGKSTIASLLERFYDPDNGIITLDGYDIRTLDPQWLRSHEPVLFGTTIKENIRFGKPDASDEEVYEAARQANADGFIQSFPDGYMTVVGERGMSLSGGQRQRIAIARALVKNPCILVLDEATSALDAESERMVQDALDHIQKGRTVLVIAHRLSSIKAADVICVLANGRTKEFWTPTGNIPFHIHLIKTIQGLPSSIKISLVLLNSSENKPSISNYSQGEVMGRCPKLFQYSCSTGIYLTIWKIAQ
eukprot:g45093.t1